MANVIDIIVWVFAVVGLLTLTSVVLYYIAKALKNYKPPAELTWPDQRYMEKIGALCPTGWVYRGKSTDGGNLCENYYKIDVPDNSTCYNYDQNRKLASFPVIKDWEKCQDPGNCRALRRRCMWIKNCGPKSQTIDPTGCNAQGQWEGDKESPFASWINVSNKC